MHGLIPNAVNPRGQISISGLQEVQAQGLAFGLSGGAEDSVSYQGVVKVPQLGEELFVIIDDNDGGKKHAWTEAYLANPNFPTRLREGRRGTIRDSDSSSSGGSGKDDQVAWDLNGFTHDVGEVVLIKRITFEAWAIVCCSGGGSSSDDSSRPTKLKFTCNGDGTGGDIEQVDSDGNTTDIPVGQWFDS